MLTRAPCALTLLFLAGCVHASATFPFAGIREQLPALRTSRSSEIPGARPRDARLALDDHVTITNGDALTVRELVAPCLLQESDAPDARHCPLRDEGSAVRVTEDPGATLLLWSVLTVALAAVTGLVGCLAGCHDTGWEIASGIGLGVGLLGATFGLLSFMGP